jgi:hypothetical protein
MFQHKNSLEKFLVTCLQESLKAGLKPAKPVTDAQYELVYEDLSEQQPITSLGGVLNRWEAEQRRCCKKEGDFACVHANENDIAAQYICNRLSVALICPVVVANEMSGPKESFVVDLPINADVVSVFAARLTPVRISSPVTLP